MIRIKRILPEIYSCWEMAIRKLWSLYRYHQRVLILPFQAIFYDAKLLENVRQHKYWFHYLLPITILGIIILDTSYLFLTYGLNPPIPYFHNSNMRFMPAFFHEHAHLVFFTIHLMTFLSNAYLIYDKYPHFRFILLASGRGPDLRLNFPYRKRDLRKIPRELGKESMAFFERFQKQAKRLTKLMAYQIQCAFTLPTTFLAFYDTYTKGWAYFANPRPLLCTIGCPLYFEYFVSSFQSAIQFICQNSMINIKQKSILRQIDSNINRVGEGNPGVFGKVYGRWRQNMHQILEVTREMTAYDFLYSKYISTIILSSSSLFVSASKTVIQAVDVPAFHTNVWIFYCTIHAINLLVLNTSASRTMYLNMKLFKRLRQLQIRLLSGRRLNRSQIVKLDLVNEYKLFLQKCAFRLLNSQTINNKFFAFQLFGGVSVFYMKLLSEEWLS